MKGTEKQWSLPWLFIFRTLALRSAFAGAHRATGKKGQQAKLNFIYYSYS
jgi:hypothetical protein